MKNFFENVYVERSIAIASLVFPFLEINAVFGPKVLTTSDNIHMNYWCREHFIAPIAQLYSTQENHIGAFIVMVLVFDCAVRKTLPLTLFCRFNIIQAVLIDIVCSFLGVAYTQTAYAARESALGETLTITIYFGTLFFIFYCAVLISCGRYPKCPVISEGARLNVQLFR
jgi:hypothetical protein|tara:strand:+ start:16548 stop:17057 length:510 start_codon:yes stop_codon:yes gene_type:complete